MQRLVKLHSAELSRKSALLRLILETADKPSQTTDTENELLKLTQDTPLPGDMSVPLAGDGFIAVNRAHLSVCSARWPDDCAFALMNLVAG